MELSQFRDVHPDWNLIASMEPDALEALLELTVTLMAIDEAYTAEERSAFAHALFDGRDVRLNPESIQRMEWNAEERLATTDDKTHGKFLKKAARKIKHEEQRIAALRMLAILAFYHKPTETEVDYLRGVGHAMGFDDMMIDDVLRAAWESRQGPVSTRVRERRQRGDRTERKYKSTFVW